MGTKSHNMFIFTCDAENTKVTKDQCPNVVVNQDPETYIVIVYANWESIEDACQYAFHFDKPGPNNL